MNEESRPVPPPHRDRSHLLYVAVIAAVALGVALGFLAPSLAVQCKPLGTGFVSLIKMLVSPVIFCTLVLGVGSVANATQVGRVGGLALMYFLSMSTVALATGLLVGNLLHPGAGMHLAPTAPLATDAAHEAPHGTVAFLLGIIPRTLVSALTDGQVLQTLFVALLVGFALQSMGPSAQPILQAVRHAQRLVFKILSMIMWLAPLGAFGAIAGVVGETGIGALQSLGMLMLAFYLTCVLFVAVVLGPLLYVVSGLSLAKLLRYLAPELLLILSTSSSETALPRLVAKMEHLGVGRAVVGVVVPTGYSFNLDGTAIYLTMASLFIAEAKGAPLAFGEQISLLLFMIIASKGAAGVTGAGIATLSGGLQSHRPDLVDGVGIIVGIDRFMSEARALTNFVGNAVATVLVGAWTRELDAQVASDVLDGRHPFDEIAFQAGHSDGGH